MRSPVRTLAALALTAPLLATAARAQSGAPPPELVVVRWFNTPELSFEDLRGKVILLEAFRTWAPTCASNVPALNTRHAKGAKKGLVVIGVTSEEVEVVEDWVRRHEATFPIAALRGNELEGFLGIAGYPTNAVVEPDGSVTYVGFSPESALATALKKADKQPYWPKKLAKVAELISVGEHAKGWAELTKVRAKGGLDEEESDKAGRLRAHLEDTASAAVERGAALFEQGLVYQAVGALRPYAEARVPFPVSEDAARQLAKIRAIPGFKDEMRAGELFEQARTRELRREFSRAFEGYAALIDKYGATLLAPVARQRAEELMKDGAPGFRLDCQACTKERRTACEKHAEEVELK